MKPPRARKDLNTPELTLTLDDLLGVLLPQCRLQACSVSSLYEAERGSDLAIHLEVTLSSVMWTRPSRVRLEARPPNT